MDLDEEDNILSCSLFLDESLFASKLQLVSLGKSPIENFI